MNHVSPSEASKILGVSKQTLRRWENEGKIDCIRTEGGHRRYHIEKIQEERKLSVVYARVSSRKQKSDLQRQIEFLQSEYPEYEVISDIGSGLNYKRPGFRRILVELFQGNIKEVVVAYKDRFTRVSFDFFEWLFDHFGASLVVLEDIDLSPQEEMAEDLLAIVTVFTARYHGARKYSVLSKN